MLETEGAKIASMTSEGNSLMKIIQAAVLVLVGALGAMLYLKVKSGPETPVPAAQAPAQPVAPAGAPDPVAAPAAVSGAPAPVPTVKSGPPARPVAPRPDRH